MISSVRKSLMTGMQAAAKVSVRGMHRATPALNIAVLTDREVGQETEFIRKKEAEQLMRTKLAHIMAQDSSNAEKQQLEKLLGVAPAEDEKKDFISKYGLNDWKFALPLGMLVGVPAISNEVIVLSEEVQLSACFILFCATMYTQVGGMLAKSLEDYRDEIVTKFKALDDNMLSSIKVTQEENKKLLDLDENVKSLFELKDQLAVSKAEALNLEEQHKFRDEVARKLDLLVSLEDSAVTALKTRMITKVKADVLNKFKSDAGLKSAALQSAISVLSAGAKGKMGKDVVGEAFVASIAAYTADYKKQPEGSDEIIKKLEADVAAIVKAPAVAAAGTNVYDTHKFFI